YHCVWSNSNWRSWARAPDQSSRWAIATSALNRFASAGVSRLSRRYSSINSVARVNCTGSCFSNTRSSAVASEYASGPSASLLQPATLTNSTAVANASFPVCLLLVFIDNLSFADARHGREQLAVDRFGNKPHRRVCHQQLGAAG